MDAVCQYFVGFQSDIIAKKSEYRRFYVAWLKHNDALYK